MNALLLMYFAFYYFECLAWCLMGSALCVSLALASHARVIHLLPVGQQVEAWIKACWNVMCSFSCQLAELVR